MTMGPEIKADCTALEATTAAFWKMSRGTKLGSNALLVGRVKPTTIARAKARASTPEIESGSSAVSHARSPAPTMEIAAQISKILRRSKRSATTPATRELGMTGMNSTSPSKPKAA